MKVIENVWPEWKVEEIIGKGSYGAVFRCVDTEGNKSAVKVISVPQNDNEIKPTTSEKMTSEQMKEYYKDIADDMVKEIELLKALKGTKNIVEIYEAEVVEKEDGIGWYILIRMELLTDFATYSKKKTFTETDIIKLGLDLSSALSVCHKGKIIHRDIKPENIFVDAQGNFKLGDFGVAKKLERTQASMSVKGTYNYMSPEVFSGKKCDGRADMYSLAIVMYQLLNNNRLPFLDPDTPLIHYSERQHAFERRIKGEELPLIKYASKELNTIVLKACAFKNIDRQKNIDEFREQLEKILKGEKVRKNPKKSTVKKWSFLVLGLIVAICFCFAGYLLVESEVLDKSEIVQNSDPSVISLELYEIGLTKDCIDNKYLYKDENGIYLFDKTANETLLITNDNSISVAFDGNKVIYQTFTEAIDLDATLQTCNWCSYDAIEQENTTIEVVDYYNSTDNDLVYFNNDYVLYKSYDYSKRQVLTMFDFETHNTKTVGYSVGDNIVAYGSNIFYSTDKTDSLEVSPVWVYDVEKQSGTLVSSKGIIDEKTVFYKNDGLYFLESSMEDDKTLITLSMYDLKTEITKTIAHLSDNGVSSLDSIVALNDKYICINNGGKYRLWINDKNEVVDIKITEEYGELIDCFINPELADKVIFLFKDDLAYRYYEVTKKGNLRSLGFVEPDADNAVVNGDIIYSVSGNEDKKIKVFDMERR